MTLQNNESLFYKQRKWKTRTKTKSSKLFAMGLEFHFLKVDLEKGLKH